MPCADGCRPGDGWWSVQKQLSAPRHESCEVPSGAHLQQGMEQARERQVHEDNIKGALSFTLALQALRVLQVQGLAPAGRRLARALPPRSLRAPAQALLWPVATCAQIFRPVSIIHRPCKVKALLSSCVSAAAQAACARASR